MAPPRNPAMPDPSQPEPIARPPCPSGSAGPEPAAGAFLGWEAGDGQFLVAAHPIGLRNEVLTLTCAVPPPPRQRVQVTLEARDGREYRAKATVAAVRALGPGNYLVRLLLRSCSRAFRWAVAESLDPVA